MNELAYGSCYDNSNTTALAIDRALAWYGLSVNQNTQPLAINEKWSHIRKEVLHGAFVATAAGGTGKTTFTAFAHGMVAGQYVAVDTTGGTEYDGTWLISSVTTNTFTAVVATGETTRAGTWICATAGAFTAVANSCVITSAAHGLAVGDQILIKTTGATSYDGLSTILAVTTNTFTIAKTVAATRAGIWIKATETMTGAYISVSHAVTGTSVFVAGMNHGVNVGDYVYLTTTGATTYDGTYAVTTVTPVSFSVVIADGVTKAGTWTKVKTAKAGIFSNATHASTGTTVFTVGVGHGVAVGWRITPKTTGGTEYDATHVVTAITATTISVAMTDAAARSGTWTAVPAGTFASVATGSTSLFTSPAHGLNLGDVITVTTTGATTYDGLATIKVLYGSDVFGIAFTDGVTKAGTWVQKMDAKSGTFSAASHSVPGTSVLTAGAGHGLVVGDIVTINTTGEDTDYDGTFVVVAVAATTFSITLATDPATKAGTWTQELGQYMVVANDSAGTSTFTCGSNHRLDVGSVVSAQTTGGVEYDGFHVVTAITPTTFSVAVADDVTRAGTYQEPSYMLAGTGAAGVYKIAANATGLNSSDGTVLLVSPFINTTAQPQCQGYGLFMDTAASESASNLTSIPVAGFLTIADGDKVFLACETMALEDTPDTIIWVNLNLSLDRL